MNVKNINFRIGRENVWKLATKIKGKLGTFFWYKNWWKNDYRILGKIGGKLVKKSIVLSQFINKESASIEKVEFSMKVLVKTFVFVDF